jgi:hypothetical protein
MTATQVLPIACEALFDERSESSHRVFILQLKQIAALQRIRDEIEVRLRPIPQHLDVSTGPPRDPVAGWVS